MTHFNIFLLALGLFFVVISSIKPHTNSKNINISDLSSEGIND